MQADAIRRVREMQRRARQQVAPPPPEPPPAKPPEKSQEKPLEQKKPAGSPLSGIAGMLGLQNDQLLLLALLLLLANEGADPSLLLALLYILL